MNNKKEFAVTNNVLTNNFAGLVTSGLGPDMARWPSVFSSRVPDTGAATAKYPHILA
jgi:hypothetical protein